MGALVLPTFHGRSREDVAAELERDVERGYMKVAKASLRATGAGRPAWVLVAAHAAVAADEAAKMLESLEPATMRTKRVKLLARRAMQVAELLSAEVEQ